jgi:hypothetical protein
MTSPRMAGTAFVPRSMMSSCAGPRARVSLLPRRPSCGALLPRLRDDADGAAALRVHLARQLDGVAGSQVRVAGRDGQDEAALAPDV